MPISTLLAILQHHSVQTTLFKGRLYANAPYTVANSAGIYQQWIDVTDFSQGDLYAWLGY
jgi:hypothetical protein